MQYPLEYEGIEVPVDGKVVFTFQGYVDHHGQTCALFDTVIDFNYSQDIPLDDVERRIQMGLRWSGKGKLYFDHENGRLAETIIAIVFDGLMLNIPNDSSATGLDAERASIRTIQDSLIHIVRK